MRRNRLNKKPRSHRQPISKSINKLFITPSFNKLLNQTKINVQINSPTEENSSKNPKMKLNCWITQPKFPKTPSKETPKSETEKYEAIRNTGKRLIKELKSNQKPKIKKLDFEKLPTLKTENSINSNTRRHYSTSLLVTNPRGQKSARKVNDARSSLASVFDSQRSRKFLKRTPTHLRVVNIRRPPQNTEKLKQESIFDTMKIIWNRPYIKQKLEKFMNYLKNLQKENSNFSFQEYLYHLTNNSLPKHNWLNDLNLKNWEKSKVIFNEICKEIENFYENLEIEELKRISYYKSHLHSLKLREEVARRVENVLKEKLNHEKAFKNYQKELSGLINVMKNDFPEEEPENNFRLIRNLRMRKYAKSWDYIAHLDTLETNRRNNRKALYLEKKLRERSQELSLR